MSHRFLSLALLSLTLTACGSEVASTPSTDAGDKSCVEGGKTYAHGASWKCSDGCNSCSCSAGLVTTTTVACGCSDSTGFHARGSSWRCPDGCNTCTCGDDTTISSTLIGCSAVDAGNSPGDAGGTGCFPEPINTHTSAACPSPAAFASIHLSTFACSDTCLRCPTNLTTATNAYCDGAKWVARSDGGCEDGSGYSWHHGPPPVCTAD